jgi:hypothetical protein
MNNELLIRSKIEDETDKENTLGSFSLNYIMLYLTKSLSAKFKLAEQSL